jgi:hypothetical protein
MADPDVITEIPETITIVPATITGAPGTITTVPSSSLMHLAEDFFIANGTWTAPARVWSPTAVPNEAQVECWGAGAGGTTNAGSGGGGEYARTPNVAVTPSAGYTVALGTSAAASDGTATTFATTTVVANGGKGVANGSLGGTGGTGTTKFDGGAGVVAAGTQRGGGGAGSAAVGNPAGVGGIPDGGTGSTSAQGTQFGGGGGCTAGAQGSGYGGACRVTYNRVATAGYPRVIGRIIGTDTTAGTTRNVSVPAGTGGMLIMQVGADGAPTVSATGWTALAQVSQGSVVLALLYRTADGADPVALATSSSVNVAWRIWRVVTPSGGVPSAPTWTTTSGNSTNVDCPDHTPAGGSAAYLWLALGALDGNAFANVTGFPTGYESNVHVGPHNLTLGVALVSAEKFATAASENPGAYTSVAEQWAAGTVSISPT